MPDAQISLRTTLGEPAKEAHVRAHFEERGSERWEGLGKALPAVPASAKSRLLRARQRCDGRGIVDRV